MEEIKQGTRSGEGSLGRKARDSSASEREPGVCKLGGGVSEAVLSPLLLPSPSNSQD